MPNSPRNMEIYGEILFERDVSEAIGFTNGDHEYLDINRECGMLGLICTLYFEERLSKLYASMKSDHHECGESQFNN